MQLQNIKSWSFTLDQPTITLLQISPTHGLETPPGPTSKAHSQFLTVPRRSTRDSFHSWGHARKSWIHTAFSFPWLTSETKRWSLRLTTPYPPPPPPTMNKTTNKKYVISVGPKQDCLLHASNIPTNAHAPTIKLFQTTKELGLVFLPLLIFNRRFAIWELKSKYMYSLFGNRSQTNCDGFCFVKYLATKQVQEKYPKVLYSLYLISGVKLC